MAQSRKTSVGTRAGTAERALVSDHAGLSLTEPLLDALQAAQLLNVRVSWVRDAAREGVLPCVRVGRHLRFTKVMLEDWLVERFNARSEALRERSIGGGMLFSSPAPAGGASRSRRVFRPQTDTALLAALSERPAHARNGK